MQATVDRPPRRAAIVRTERAAAEMAMNIRSGLFASKMIVCKLARRKTLNF